MSNFIAQIVDFYRDIIADIETVVLSGKSMVKISPLSRRDFLLKGNAGAIILFIEKCSYSIFYLITTVFTCGVNKHYRDSLFKNVREGLVCIAAIPLAFAGALFPQTINQKVLDIPPGGN